MKFFKLRKINKIEEIIKKKGKIYFLAGCTDFYVYYKDGFIKEDSILVDISEIKELKGIKEDRNSIVIGSLTTFTEIIDSRILNKHANVLVKAAKTIGSKQIRNRATIGGNVANASPAGDSIPALFVLDSKLELVKGKRKRIVKVEEFFKGVKTTILENGEIIKSIIIPKKNFNKSVFNKIGPRNALSISKVSIAVNARVERKIIEDIAISFGSVYKTVVRCRESEEKLKRKKIDKGLIEEAKKLALNKISPITDFRSTGLYRFAVAGVLFERAIEEILN